MAALWAFVVVPVGKGTQDQPATKAQLAPLWPPLLPRITFQAEVSQTQLLFHIKVAPGELRQSPARLWRCADRRSVDFLPLKSRLQVTYEVSFFACGVLSSVSALHSLDLFCRQVWWLCFIFVVFFSFINFWMFFSLHSELNSLYCHITLKSRLQNKKSAQFCRKTSCRDFPPDSLLNLVSVSLQEPCFSLTEFLPIILKPNFVPFAYRIMKLASIRPYVCLVGFLLNKSRRLGCIEFLLSSWHMFLLIHP